MNSCDTDREVLIQEVGPRDGLQNEQRILPVEARARLIEDLTDAGMRSVQIGSFVSGRRVPQMAGTDEVWQLLKKRKDTRYSVLVLNRRGLDRARQAGLKCVELYVSASETHSMKNSGMSVAAALSEVCAMVGEASNWGMQVTAGVMCAFGCFYEGAVVHERVKRLVAEMLEHGPAEIGLADTTGMGEPREVKRLIELLAGLIDLKRLGLHLHDTRGMGIANMVAALEMGIRRFDSSIGGLGGCPFIPGAAGNISTEVAAQTLLEHGYHTGIDTAALQPITQRLEAMLGRTFSPGRIAGTTYH